MKDGPWLKPLDAKVLGQLRQVMAQQTDGKTIILRPKPVPWMQRDDQTLLVPFEPTPAPTPPPTIGPTHTLPPPTPTPSPTHMPTPTHTPIITPTIPPITATPFHTPTLPP